MITDSARVRDTLVLTRSDVAALREMDGCIAAVEAAFRAHADGATLPPGVLGTHVGEGAWAIFYQVEDGTPARLDAATAGAEGSARMQEGIAR